MWWWLEYIVSSELTLNHSNPMDVWGSNLRDVWGSNLRMDGGSHLGVNLLF